MDNENSYRSKKIDLRVQKTHKALLDALLTLLRRRNFNDITINDLCSEAFVSRATFYSHFNDKYDLLNYYLTGVRKSVIKDVYKYDELEREINQFISSNKKVIANIVKEANSETIKILREFMSSIVDLTIKRKMSNDKSPHHIILFNFFIGGLFNLLTWIVENNFPPEITMMNTYFYKMVESITNWDAEQELKERWGKDMDI